MIRERQKQPTAPDWRSVAAVRFLPFCKIFGVSPSTGRRMIEAGDLKVVRVGRVLLVPTSEIKRLLNEPEVMA